MHKLNEFEDRDGIALFRIVGTYTFNSAAQLGASVIQQAIERGSDRLLIDCLGMSGFPPPSLAARHEMVRQWAQIAQGRIRVVLVISSEYIDSEKFAIVAANNMGLVGNVFETEEEALEWLLLEVR